MTAPAKAAKPMSFRRLSRRALSIGAVKASDKAMKFLLPVVLVRCLDTATFGEYRLLWLVVGTVMTIATLNMAGGLNYFLPRSDAPTRRLYVHHTMLFLAASALFFAALSGPWNPWLPEAIAPLAKYGALVPAFVGLWIAAILLDFLPTIDERVRWQAWASVGTSLLRVALIAGGAFFTRDLAVVMALMMVAVVVKLGLILYYVWRYHGMGRPWFDRAVFADQFRHIAPFGVSGALYGLRGQADQWVAAALFSLHSFAAFSVASVLNQFVVVFRRSVVEAFLPNMSRLQAAGDVRGMMSLNSRANVMVGTVLYPALAFVFAFANEVITLVYTADYLEAAPVMRVYIVSICILVLEIGSVLLLLRQGKFALGANSVALAVSVSMSFALASTVGLAGAAGGSLAAVLIDRTLMLRRISAQVGIPMRELQDWRGLFVAFCYALASAALIRIAVDLLAYDGGAFARLALGACGLAIAYLPIAWRWRAR